ncbi:uncharacterized protein EDB93DRAFT_1101841 [Suillus bovinus]|uniref:uncharacterized protein n=1 Tax=Suillus bovinus TaxID=48563 RepID=UPI001B8843F0|nr:uncharacterized protein EDB93DRAFT_1101841 [Suillus bovinus]KAG2155270.1 hypothetical protein EDB93DRAFT_1101841 [Suillus bovinus]
MERFTGDMVGGPGEKREVMKAHTDGYNTRRLTTCTQSKLDCMEIHGRKSSAEAEVSYPAFSLRSQVTVLDPLRREVAMQSKINRTNNKYPTFEAMSRIVLEHEFPEFKLAEKYRNLLDNLVDLSLYHTERQFKDAGAKCRDAKSNVHEIFESKVTARTRSPSECEGPVCNATLRESSTDHQDTPVDTLITLVLMKHSRQRSDVLAAIAPSAMNDSRSKVTGVRHHRAFNTKQRGARGGWRHSTSDPSIILAQDEALEIETEAEDEKESILNLCWKVAGKESGC